MAPRSLARQICLLFQALSLSGQAASDSALRLIRMHSSFGEEEERRGMVTSLLSMGGRSCRSQTGAALASSARQRAAQLPVCSLKGRQDARPSRPQHPPGPRPRLSQPPAGRVGCRGIWGSSSGPSKIKKVDCIRLRGQHCPKNQDPLTRCAKKPIESRYWFISCLRRDGCWVAAPQSQHPWLTHDKALSTFRATVISILQFC